MAYTRKFDNEAKCIDFSSFQYQVTAKMLSEVTCVKGRTSMSSEYYVGPKHHHLQIQIKPASEHDSVGSERTQIDSQKNQ